MATIFDGYAKASDEQIADQVALFEVITLTNCLKPYWQKTHRAGVRMVNSVRGFFGATENIAEPKVREVRECIEECRDRLRGVPRSELNNRLKAVLCARTSSTAPVSDDALSVRVIEESAKRFKIDEDLTPAQKADRVYEHFYEQVLSNLQKTLKKQDEKDAQRTTRALEDKIKNLSDEQRAKIQEILKVEKLTGETMRSALLRAGAPAAILAAVTAAGFGSFIALSTILHAVFTSILGITLPFVVYMKANMLLAWLVGPPGWILILGIGSWQMLSGSRAIDREMLAQSVWLAVGSYGRPFTPADEELPSWVPKMKRVEVDRKDEEYAVLVSQRNAAVVQEEAGRKQLEKLQAELESTRKALLSEAEKRKTAEDTRKELEDRQARLEQERSSAASRTSRLESDLKAAGETARAAVSAELEKVRDELKRKDAELHKTIEEKEYQGELLTIASKEIAEKEKKLECVTTMYTRSQGENEEFKRSAENARQKALAAEESRRKELEALWPIHFPGFLFKPDMVREAAKLHFRDRCRLEKVLRELHGAREPRALSRGKLQGTDSDHLGMRLSDGVPARVEYRVLSGQKSGIELIKFYKHNQKYMNS